MVKEHVKFQQVFHEKGVIKGIPTERKLGGSIIETPSQMMVWSLENNKPQEVEKEVASDLGSFVNVNAYMVNEISTYYYENKISQDCSLLGRKA